ncbi:MAG: hypothetical protein OXF02_01285 [Simkaniaceae bacterium]|nr:hypothetical protein [Simkaniaceae bacterium]
MSCFGCFRSSRSGSPTRVVEEEATRCPFPKEEVSERISDLVRGSPDPGKPFFSVAVPPGERTTVLYQQSDRSLQQDESRLPAKIVTLSPPQGKGAESENAEEFGRLLAELGQEENLAEKLTTTHLKTPGVGMQADAPAVGRPSVLVPVVSPTVPCTEEEGFGQAEEEKQALSAMTARLDALKDGSVVLLTDEEEALMMKRANLVVPLTPGDERGLDEIVPGEDPKDEVIDESAADGVDALIVSALEKSKAFRDTVRNFAREHLN